MTRRRGDYSLLRRLIWRIIATAAVSALVLYGALYLQLYLTIDTLYDRTLNAQADDIVRHLGVASDQSLQLTLPETLAQAYADPDSDFSFQILDMAGTVLFSSRSGGAPLDQIDRRSQDFGKLILLRTPGQPRSYAKEKIFEGPVGPLRIRVGQGASNEDLLSEETLDEFSEAIVWLVFPVFAAMSAIIAFTLKRGMQPVAEASRQAAAIGPRSIHVRLKEDGMPAEVRPLVRAINAGLDRLERGFKAQRDFTADAAHELRTPLAILQAHLDTLSDRQSAQALSGEVKAMSRIVEQLLRIAQLEAETEAPDAVADLRAVATDVAANLAPLALRGKKALVVSGDDGPVFVRIDAEILRHAVRNLVENALAVVPSNGNVELTVGADGTLHVDDDGPGVPPASRDAIFQRFWRGDHSGGKMGGAGLGLPIVARIAELAGGTVDVADSPLGGARFTLRLRRDTAMRPASARATAAAPANS